MNELSGASVGPQTPQAPAAPSLPSPFLDVANGLVPAISLAPIEGKKTDPAQEYAVSNLDELSASGIEYHEIADTNESVFFNPSKISAEQIDEAYKAGKLHEIAPLARDLKPIGAPTEPAAPAQAQAPLSGASVGG
jgi:hypothetical protein